MNFQDQRKLFTSAEVCRACGISRTTLFRLEEIGFLKPYIVNPTTGYRYYDLQNITAIGQFQKLQILGLSKKEIVNVYYESIDSEEFLKTQRQKMYMMQRFLNEYEYQHDHNKSNLGTFITLPAISCYCTDITVSSFDEAAMLDYLAHEKCVDEGYQLLGTEPLFGILNGRDVWQKAIGSKVQYTFCIPIQPCSASDPNIHFFPETKGFSVIGYGDYSCVATLEKRFWEEIDKRNLTPSGSVRLIMHVGGYTGAHYKSENYCYEYVLPIE